MKSSVGTGNGFNQGAGGGLRPCLVFILGMHRSGTSALAKVLWNAGFFAGEENELIRPDLWNRDGYFERWPVVKANEFILNRCGGTWDAPPNEEEIRNIAMDSRIESLLAPYAGYPRAFIKDPRLCITLPVWERVMPGHARIVTVTRDPEAVAASLMKRDRFSREKALGLWHTYTERAASNSRKYPSCSLRYEDLFTEKRRPVMERLSDFLDLDANLEAVAARAIDPLLQHNRPGGLHEEPAEPEGGDPKRLYETSQHLAKAGRYSEAITVLERLVKADPGHALALNDLGALCFHRGRKAEALALLERSVQIDPRNATARKNLAAVYQALGRKDGIV
jgi:hypothetical protein